MTFSYSISLTSDLDRVRFNLADTNSAAYAFEDEEITALLSSEGTVNAATAACIRALIADKARRTKKFSDNGLSLDDTAQVAQLREMLSLYGGDAPTMTVTFPALIPSDEGYVETWS